MLPLLSRTYRPFYTTNLFDDNFFPVLTGRTTSLPAVNIREDEKNYFIEFAVPGLNKQDLRIDMNNDTLTISYESKNEKEEKHNGYNRKEFNFSSFNRSFYIPEDADRDKIEGSYRDGILTVTVPKQEQEKSSLSRQIRIE